jgi:hypothetical protein
MFCANKGLKEKSDLDCFRKDKMKKTKFAEYQKN